MHRDQPESLEAEPAPALTPTWAFTPASSPVRITLRDVTITEHWPDAMRWAPGMEDPL